jgi:hypothetical protein
MRVMRPVLCSRLIAALTTCAWMVLCSAIHFSSNAYAAGDAEQIRSVIGATWDKPDSKVEIDPVVVAGVHAVASWTQGSHGGRALMRRGNKGWVVVLCSGDPLKSAKWLEEAGVPKDDARHIAEGLGAAEALVPPHTRAKFSLFEGVVSGEREPHHH